MYFFEVYNKMSYVQAHGENTNDTFTSDTPRVSTSYQMTSCSDNMKTVQGMLCQKIVKVLRDTGCTGVIVKQSLVPGVHLQVIVTCA